MVMTMMKTITKYDYELAFSLDSADENDSSQSPSNQRGDSPRVHFQKSYKKKNSLKLGKVAPLMEALVSRSTKVPNATNEAN